MSEDTDSRLRELREIFGVPNFDGFHRMVSAQPATNMCRYGVVQAPCLPMSMQIRTQMPLSTVGNLNDITSSATYSPQTQQCLQSMQNLVSCSPLQPLRPLPAYNKDYLKVGPSSSTRSLDSEHTYEQSKKRKKTMRTMDSDTEVEKEREKRKRAREECPQARMDDSLFGDDHDIAPNNEKLISPDSGIHSGEGGDENEGNAAQVMLNIITKLSPHLSPPMNPSEREQQRIEKELLAKKQAAALKEKEEEERREKERKERKEQKRKEEAAKKLRQEERDARKERERAEKREREREERAREEKENQRKAELEQRRRAELEQMEQNMITAAAFPSTSFSGEISFKYLSTDSMKKILDCGKKTGSYMKEEVVKTEPAEHPPPEETDKKNKSSTKEQRRRDETEKSEKPRKRKGDDTKASSSSSTATPTKKSLIPSALWPPIGCEPQPSPSVLLDEKECTTNCLGENSTPAKPSRYHRPTEAMSQAKLADFYQHLARQNKRNADSEQTDKLLRQLMYMECVVYFVLSARYQVNQQNDVANTKQYTILRDTKDLLKLVTMMYMKACETGFLRHFLPRVRVLCQKSGAVLFYHLYRCRESQALKTYALLDVHLQLGAEEVKVETPTPPGSSAGPSPSTSVHSNSNHGRVTPSGISGGGPLPQIQQPVPQPMTQTDCFMRQQLRVLHNLMFAHRLWDEAKQDMATVNTDFFKNLEMVCSPLHLESPLESLCTWLLTGVTWLRKEHADEMAARSK